MTYQFIFMEERTQYNTADPTDKGKPTWIETDKMTTSSKKVMAGVMRAKAEELDPLKPTTRSYDG